MVGDRGHYFLFTKFLEIFYMFKICSMVALDSLRHFHQIFQNFLSREGVVRLVIVWYSDKFFRISLLLGGQGVNIYLTFLKNLYEFSSPLFTGSCKICQLSVMKNLTNQNWSRGRQRNVNESRYKIITKEYHKETVSFFRFLKETTLSFLIDGCCGYLLFVSEKRRLYCFHKWSYKIPSYMKELL